MIASQARTGRFGANGMAVGWPLLRLMLLLPLLLAALFLTGCDRASDQARQNAVEIRNAAPPVQTLASGDKVQVTVFGEDSISGEFTVDDDGFLSVPLAGTVKAAGLTKIQLEKLLTAKLTGDYLANPRITVTILSFRPFYIMGEVVRPGQYSYQAGLNIMSAMAIAGGPTYRASNARVEIQRNGAGPFKEYPLSPEVPVFPGDVVRVPERYF